jgi:acetolactate synthase-1/2/3 large subunit/sulfoacetaldehyde acetyltransferase
MAEKVTGGEAVYRVLKAAGVKTVFGLLGGSMLELYDAIYKDGGIAYVGARDERAAGHMADAYARITGGPGVVLGAQAGPGVANLVTAVAEAHLAYSPLVVLAGAISRPDLGKDTFQEIDQVALFAPIAKRSVLVTDPARLPTILVDGIRLAMSGRRGPVVLHVPRDLFAAEIDAPVAGPVTVARAGPPRPEDVTAIIDMLAQAARPVIVAGGGCKWAGGASALAALAERLEIPVVASTGHADVMRHGHPLYAGQGGPRGNAVASRLTREADLLLVIGARLAFNSTFHSHDYVTATGRIVHIDIEPASVGRYFPAALAIQADAKASAEAILAASGGLSPARWQEWLARFRDERAALEAERAAEAANDAMPLHPRRALAEIRAALPENAIVTLDTGNTCLQAADRLAHYRTPSLITPLDFGLVGFGYAAALGAQAAAPERPVVAVIGDGGFGYTMAEVMTAAQNRLPVVAVVLDNGAWGAEKAYQQEFFGGRLLGAEIDSPPFDQIALLCGADGYAVSRPGELGPALREALAARRPAVIHAKIDPAALSTLRKDLFKPAKAG